MKTILLTNDDGYKSAGFYNLLNQFSAIEDWKIVPVAPAHEQSWISKSVSTRKTLQLEEKKIGNYTVSTLDGTPADCVQIGLYNILTDRPDLVISGINIGENTGIARILSSGTIGAAMEASIDGVRSIASSIHIPKDIKQVTDFNDENNYPLLENAAKITLKVAQYFIDNDFPENTDLISINIPFDATIDSPIEITKPFKDHYGKLFHTNENGFTHKTPTSVFSDVEAGTDSKAIGEGKISITPICLELVSGKALVSFEEDIKNYWVS